MSTELLEVNGTRLFVDIRGSDTAPPLLYVHGGPGQSCFDFMAVQGDRLARDLRIIGVDQRGILRSDELPAEPPLTVDLLLADYEAIRPQLGITSWAILGHSAGGGYALAYATAHRQSVNAAIYDCPCWDADLTDRFRLPIVAARLRALGDEEAAARCEALASKPGRITAADESRLAMQALGDDYLSLFFHDRGGVAEHQRLTEQGGFPIEQWRRGLSHLPLLLDMYESKLDLLGKVRQPSLLIRGRHDLVVPPAAVEMFCARVVDAAVHTFERSGHHAYLEEPDEYSRVVSGFVLDRSPRITAWSCSSGA